MGSEDLISKQTAYEVLTEYYHHKTETQHEALREALGRVPSAQPERKTGKWVWMGDTGDSRWMCSVCKGKENVPTIMGEPTVWDFCPNCGARMVREGAEDEAD